MYWKDKIHTQEKQLRMIFFFKDQPRTYINKSIEVDKKPFGESWQKEQFIHKGKKIRFPVDFSEATLYVEDNKVTYIRGYKNISHNFCIQIHKLLDKSSQIRSYDHKTTQEILLLRALPKETIRKRDSDTQNNCRDINIRTGVRY